MPPPVPLAVVLAVFVVWLRRDNGPDRVDSDEVVRLNEVRRMSDEPVLVVRFLSGGGGISDGW